MRWLCSFGKMFQSNTCLGCASAGYHIAAVVIHSDRDNYFDHHRQCFAKQCCRIAGEQIIILLVHTSKRNNGRELTSSTHQAQIHFSYCLEKCMNEEIFTDEKVLLLLKDVPKQYLSYSCLSRLPYSCCRHSFRQG